MMRKIFKKLLLILVALFLANSAISLYAQDEQELLKEYYRKGNLYYQQGKYKLAQEEYQKALALLNGRASAAKAAPAFVPEKTVSPQKSTVVAPQPQVQQKIVAPSAAKVQTQPQPQPQTTQTLEYLIGEEDVLHIAVWQEPDLDQEVIVRPDGRISFPLVGDIQAAGLTIPQLDELISEKLKQYVKFPEVSISIQKLGGKKVIVLGEILSPGVYSVSGSKTLLEAIALAGGFTKDAVPSSTVLIRGGFANPQPQRLNLNQALKGDLRQNVALQSEDIIFIPKKFIADLNYFLNQIMQPLQEGSVPFNSIMLYRQFIKSGHKQ